MMKIVLTTEKRKKNVRSQQDLQVNQKIENGTNTTDVSFEEQVKSNSRARDIVAYVV